jgi:hypothetical protein
MTDAIDCVQKLKYLPHPLLRRSADPKAGAWCLFGPYAEMLGPKKTKKEKKVDPWNEKKKRACVASTVAPL